jgi:hypothetical protein
MRFLKGIKNSSLREATRHRLPSKESLKSAAWAAREVPKAPKSLDTINLDLMNRPAGGTEGEGVNFGDYLLAHEVDTTDGSTQGERRAGHYISLRPKPVLQLAAPEQAAANEEIIKAEMTIMELLSTNAAIVTPSLYRLEALRVSATELLVSDVCSVLYATIYPLHSADTEAGKLVRKLIKRYEDTLRAGGMVGDGLNITAVDDSFTNTDSSSSGNIRDIFNATSTMPIMDEEEQDELELEDDVGAAPVASTSFLREARDKLASRDISVQEKETIVEKLRMMSIPLAGLEQSPMIGRAVRQFYRKVAPPQSRARTVAGKLYQDLRRQLLSNSAIREMEERGDLTVIPSREETYDGGVEDALQFGERLVAGTSFTIRLAEEEDDVFDVSAIPAVNCINFHSASISEAEAPMESTAASFSFQAESQHEITDVRKRKMTEK